MTIQLRIKTAMKIVRDNLTGSAIVNLLNEHIKDMQTTSPPESKHALDVYGLQKSEAQFWSI
jgi:putative acetyltransferase